MQPQATFFVIGGRGVEGAGTYTFEIVGNKPKKEEKCLGTSNF